MLNYCVLPALRKISHVRMKIKENPPIFLLGLKYEGENEDDLKDKQDFVKPDPEHYPSTGELFIMYSMHTYFGSLY